MRSWGCLLCLLTLLPLNTAFADCDISQFRWGCDIKIHPKATKHAHSLVYCGNSYGYVSLRDYDILSRYQRANINLVLTIDGDYVESPCVPAGRYGPG